MYNNLVAFEGRNNIGKKNVYYVWNPVRVPKKLDEDISFYISYRHFRMKSFLFNAGRNRNREDSGQGKEEVSPEKESRK